MTKQTLATKELQRKLVEAEAHADYEDVTIETAIDGMNWSFDDRHAVLQLALAKQGFYRSSRVRK